MPTEQQIAMAKQMAEEGCTELNKHWPTFLEVFGEGIDPFSVVVGMSFASACKLFPWNPFEIYQTFPVAIEQLRLASEKVGRT